MIPTIKGVKLGMTSVFDATGTTTAVTLVRPYRAVVTDVKTPARDGYSAVQLAYREALPKHVNKPLKGILNRAGVEDSFTKVYEVKVPEAELPNYRLGDILDPSTFLIAWSEVDVIGMSKGKGFAGVVKRHHFRGQCRTHGDPDNRRPQSGGATDPARVFKGSRRPGHMGFERIKLRSCSVYEYFRKLNVMVIQGSLPGPVGAELTLVLRKEFTAEEQAEHEKMITLDEHQLALIETDSLSHAARGDVKPEAQPDEAVLPDEDAHGLPANAEASEMESQPASDSPEEAAEGEGK